MEVSRCPECGTEGVNGRAGCEALFDEIRYQALSDFRIAKVHRLAFDTYCMQHIETYCVSAKSYAAHLTGLCCGVEYKGDQVIYDVIHRWLNGNVPLQKPEVLPYRGKLCITDVLAAQEVEDRVRRIYEWADHVWSVYESQHEIARKWVQLMRSSQSY
jgi:hypothetical protein